MKKLVFLCCAITLFFFSSCSWSGDGGKTDASSMLNYTGLLVTKTPTDFDNKFGYEVVVYNYSDDSTKIIDTKVFVPKKTWERLPEPNDSLEVYIEYLKDIEYGENAKGVSIFWDLQFNLCTGFTVKTKK